MPTEPIEYDLDRRIHKFPLELTEHQTVTFRSPAPCADLLTVQMQNDVPTLWVETDRMAPEHTVHIFIVGTGNPIPDNAVMHLGTVIDDGYVWHIYASHEHHGDDEH